MNRTLFISSTFEDLKSHRKAVWDLLEKFDVNIRGMERFGARSGTPLVTCIAELEQSDVYIGIIAMKAGSIEPISGKSYTQLEYERAYELKKTILVYLLDTANAPVLEQNIDFDERREKLIAFKSVLKERHTVDWFTTEKDLAQKLEHSLRPLLASKTTNGAEPANELDRGEATLQKALLLPRVHSGIEVRLRVRLPKQFAAASREACDKFNLRFGATLAGSISIVSAKGVSAFDTLLVPEEFTDQILTLGDKEVDVYATVAFSTESVKSFRATLGSSSRVSLRTDDFAIGWPPHGMREEREVVEGALALVLTKMP